MNSICPSKNVRLEDPQVYASLQSVLVIVALAALAVGVAHRQIALIKGHEPLMIKHLSILTGSTSAFLFFVIHFSWPRSSVEEPADTIRYDPTYVTVDHKLVGSESEIDLQGETPYEQEQANFLTEHYTRRTIAGDGNCLFTSLAAGLLHVFHQPYSGEEWEQIGVFIEKLTFFDVPDDYPEQKKYFQTIKPQILEELRKFQEENTEEKFHALMRDNHFIQGMGYYLRLRSVLRGAQADDDFFISHQDSHTDRAALNDAEKKKIILTEMRNESWGQGQSVLKYLSDLNIIQAQIFHYGEQRGYYGFELDVEGDLPQLCFISYGVHFEPLFLKRR